MSTAAVRTRERDAIDDVHQGAMDGFISTVHRAQRNCKDPNDPNCTGAAKDSGENDVMSYHTQSDIPNYWDYAKNFVLQDHMFQPNASWSLPEHLFKVSEWSADCPTHDPATCTNARHADPGAGERRPAEPAEEARADLCVDGPHLSAAPTERVVGLLRRRRHEPDCATTPRSVARRPAEHADTRDLEPAALLRHGQAERPTEEHPVGGELLRRREKRNASRGLVGRPVGRGQRTSAANRLAGMAYVTSLVNAVMRGPDWDSHRDLRVVGRLGRLLRPCRAARKSTSTATDCACPGS